MLTVLLRRGSKQPRDYRDELPTTLFQRPGEYIFFILDLGGCWAEGPRHKTGRSREKKVGIELDLRIKETRRRGTYESMENEAPVLKSLAFGEAGVG